MNCIIKRIKIATDINESLDTYIIGKKLTPTGLELKTSLTDKLVNRLKELAIALKRNNKNVSFRNLWNILQYSSNQYINVNLSDIDKITLFKIIVDNIVKDNITTIDPDYMPKKRTIKQLIFNPEIFQNYKFDLITHWNSSKALTTRINALLNNDDILSFFINQYKLNDMETLNNICAEYNIKKPTEEYLNQLKELLINKLQTTIKTNMGTDIIYELKKDIFSKFIQTIQTNLNKIMPLVDFPRAKEGGGRLYEHSWQGQGSMDNRKDADPIFIKLGKDEDFAKEICNLANLNLDDIKKACKINNWNAFIINNWKKNYKEHLHIKVRKYLINYNNNVLANESNNLISRDIKEGKTTTIDYNPRKDQYREKPFIVIRKYDPRTYKFVKDLVIIGDRGANHSSILFKPENETMVKLNDEVNNHKLFWSCGYIIGNIAFIALADQKNQEPNNTYLIENIYTPKKLAQLIKQQQPEIQQVFTIPDNNSGGTIVRLAKKIHI